MKLTEKTKTILQNFSKISNAMVFHAGKKQKVMTAGKSIIAEVELEEEFPKEFGILYMDKFLSTLSFFEQPELTFEDKNLVISDDSGSKATFWYTERTLIGNVPPIDKSISIKEPDLNFELSKDNYEFITSSASALGLPNFVIEGDGTNLSLTVRDVDSPTSNKMSKVLAKTSDEFSYVGNVSDLRMLKDDYDVTASKKGIIQFKSKSDKLTYWVAIRT